MFTVFGQFLDHDINLTPVDGAVADCCTDESPHDECMIIPISRYDPFYSKVDPPQRCLEV